MTDYKTENCLILLADPDFSVLAGKAINNQLKNELLINAFPQGSSWKAYAKTRSISFFKCKAYSDTFALTYSIITPNIESPVISFVILVDNDKAKAVLNRDVKGVESTFIQKLDAFFSLDNKTANILKDNLLFYKSLSGVETSQNPIRQIAQQQTLFIMPYKNPRQWTSVESAIIKFVFEKSSKDFLSFRTFALQKEPEFKVLGLVQVSNIKQSDTFFRSIIVFTIIAAILILAVLGLLILLGIINFDNNASQQSVHLTGGILRHFRAFFYT